MPRQRIGSDYRLLFQLNPDHLRVIDLINRKDFLTGIKHRARFARSRERRRLAKTNFPSCGPI